MKYPEPGQTLDWPQHDSAYDSSCRLSFEPDKHERCRYGGGRELNRFAAPVTIRFLIVSGFTSFNLLLGLSALLLAVADCMALAAWCLLACVLLDAVDGLLARHWNVTSAFGAQFDSLADMTSFTIASAVLFFYWLQPGMHVLMLAGASGLYVLSGAIRLARFNVSLPSTQYFQGMPTTIVAAVVATTYLAFPQLNSALGVLLVVLLALLMVSVFPYPKLSQIRKLPPLVWPMIVVGMLIHFSWTIWIIGLMYITTGPAIWLHQRIARVRSCPPAPGHLE